MAYAEHQQQSQAIVCRFAVITLSDTRTPETDTSGQTISRLLTEAGHAVGLYKLLPDDPVEAFSALLENCLVDDQIHAIVTNGGTGIYKRDLAVPAVEQIIDTPLPGFGELFRVLSYEQIGSGAMASRAVGGVARRKPVFALPGSTKAVELAMTKLILPEIRHLLGELRKK
ncbi:molybdenum cofactor biosynthesis protein MoaB [soil metagenome]